MFTDKELKVARMKLGGMMNNKIAEILSVSEADISQTLSRLSRKVKTVQDSTKLLMDVGVIQEGPKYVMTEEGRQLTRLPERPTPIPQDYKLVRLSTLSWKEKGLEETTLGIYAVPDRLPLVIEGTPIPMHGISGKITSGLIKEHQKFLITSQQTQITKFPQ